MSQYFENDVSLTSHLRKISLRLFDREFSFYTDNGVFSKTPIDYGSKLLLESLPLSSITGDILDVGCGYGTLGIVLERVLHHPVTMVDVNRRAVHLTRRNIKENHCELAEVLVSDGYEKIAKKYQTIITNPPIRAGKEVVYRILIGAKDYLEKDGNLFFVIRKEQGAKSTISELEKYYDITVLERKKGFFIIWAKKG